MAPRPDVSEQRRSQILDAATTVFARTGFERARMDDIADEAGVSKGALYLYYKSKDAIIAALLKFFFDQALKQIQALAHTAGSATEQLLTMTRQLMREMDRMVALQPVTLQFYAIAARNATVRQHLNSYFAQYLTIIEDILRRGIAQGEFRAPVDPTEAAISYSALFEGLALLWIINPDGANWHQQLESSVRLLLRGLAVSPEASDASEAPDSPTT